MYSEAVRYRKLQRHIALRHHGYVLQKLRRGAYILLHGNDAVPILSIDALEAKIRTLDEPQPLHAA